MYLEGKHTQNENRSMWGMLRNLSFLNWVRAQPEAEFTINLDRGMFAAGQGIREMHRGFIEHVV